MDVLGFSIVRDFKDGYCYCNLETGSGIHIGIAPASDVGVTPGDRASNSVLLQVGVPVVKALFEHLQGPAEPSASGRRSTKWVSLVRGIQ